MKGLAPWKGLYAMNKKIQVEPYPQSLIFTIIGKKPNVPRLKRNKKTQSFKKYLQKKTKNKMTQTTTNKPDYRKINKEILYESIENKEKIKNLKKVLRYKEEINKKQEKMIEYYADEYNQECNCLPDCNIQ